MNQIDIAYIYNKQRGKSDNFSDLSLIPSPSLSLILAHC